MFADADVCPLEMIVNMEWATFGDGLDVLPVNKFDRMVDDSSASPGTRTLEKLTSGLYLGELARYAALRLGKSFFADAELKLCPAPLHGEKSDSQDSSPREEGKPFTRQSGQNDARYLERAGRRQMLSSRDI